MVMRIQNGKRKAVNAEWPQKGVKWEKEKTKLH